MILKSNFNENFKSVNLNLVHFIEDLTRLDIEMSSTEVHFKLYKK